MDFAGEVAFAVTFPAVLAGDVDVGSGFTGRCWGGVPGYLAGDVAVGVASPDIAGVASLSDLAVDVAVGVHVASPSEWLRRPLLGRHPWPTLLVVSLLEWLHRPLLGWRPWLTLLVVSLLEWLHRPLLGWRPWLTLLVMYLFIETSLTVARAAPLGDFAEVVTVEVTPSAVAAVASLADAGVTFPADLVRVAFLADAGAAPLANSGAAPLVDAGVVFLVDAGVASPADAGMLSLADFAGSVAGGVTDLTMPVQEKTEEVTFLREGVVQNRSVLDCSGYYDGEMICGDDVSAEAWCQEMPEICDDLYCHYVNYVGCDPDCVDLTVLEVDVEYASLYQIETGVTGALAAGLAGGCSNVRSSGRGGGGVRGKWGGGG